MMHHRNYWRSIWGIFLVIIGLSFLFQAFGVVNLDWSKIWPVLIIFWGLSMLFKRGHCHCGMPWCPMDEERGMMEEGKSMEDM